MSKRVVGLAGGQYEAAICDLLPANKGRSGLVNAMIEAYGLHDLCENITVKPAKKEDLIKFHDSTYVDYLLRPRREVDEELSSAQRISLERFQLGNSDVLDDQEYDSDQESDSNDTLFSYGLLYDCPLFPYMSKYVHISAGSSISAARYLALNNQEDKKDEVQRVSINWNGGRHHAKKARASGFCYINDIVLAINELRKTFEKVIYIDLDLHHGDGVESAFKFSDKVLTFSIHRKDIGFFPGTGALEDIGKGKGHKYCFNIPIKHGMGDQSLDHIINDILEPVVEKFEPDCLVVQCGVDGLSSDEHQEWNLTIKGFGKQIEKILSWNKPTLLLGGGGYEHRQVARCWTYLTSITLGKAEVVEFDLIPEHDLSDVYEDENYEFWNVPPKNMIDENTGQYINDIAKVIHDRIKSW